MAKEMKNLKETTQDYYNSNYGIWIECTKCKKWRKSYDYGDSHEVHENWCCTMNTLDNGTKGNCNDPEEITDEEYLEYSPGSLVWAKLDGYPWWPGMVDVDPDVVEYYRVKENGTLLYNITFLDENVSRSWVSLKNICSFSTSPKNTHLSKDQWRKYSSALMKAKERAEIAVKMAFKDRLQKFSFVHLYKGNQSHAKEIESEHDSQDMDDILLDEVNYSPLSFDSDVSYNYTLLEKEKNLHDGSITILSDVIDSVNATKSDTNLNNAQLPFAVKSNSSNRRRNVKISGEEIENNVGTNEKDNLNDLKDIASSCKDLDPSGKKRAKLNVKEKNSEGETSPQYHISNLSEIGNIESMDNIKKSIDWVVKYFKITENIVIDEFEKIEKIKSSKKVPSSNNQKEIVSFSFNKNVIDDNLYKNKKMKRPEESLGSNSNGANKKIKPSFNSSRLSLKNIKNPTRNASENAKDLFESNATEKSKISTVLSKIADTNINSSDSKTINFEGNAIMLSNSNKITKASDGMKSECQQNDSILEPNCKEPFYNQCTSNSELSELSSASSKNGTEIFVSNGLKALKKPNKLPITRVKDETIKKDSDTVTSRAVKSKKLMKIHKMKPIPKERKKVLPKNNEITKPEVDVEEKMERGTYTHENFNLIKRCNENFAKLSEILNVSM